MIGRRELAKTIDNALLKPHAGKEEVRAFCEAAREYHFAAVTVFPQWAPLAAEVLRGTDVKVCVPIGFPFGGAPTPVKLFEVRTAIAAGATEADVVINLGAIKSRDWSAVRRDLEEVVKVAKLAGFTENGPEVITKVILETCYLTDDEKITACKLAVDAGAEFVETSTGFGPVGATCADVRLLRRAVGKDIGVKAVGSIATWQAAVELLQAGATRLGTSEGAHILDAMPEEEVEEV